MARVDYRVTVEASFTDKVRALRSLAALYRRVLPERLAAIERALDVRGAPEARPRPAESR